MQIVATGEGQNGTGPQAIPHVALRGGQGGRGHRICLPHSVTQIVGFGAGLRYQKSTRGSKAGGREVGVKGRKGSSRKGSGKGGRSNQRKEGGREPELKMGKHGRRQQGLKRRRGGTGRVARIRITPSGCVVRMCEHTRMTPTIT